MNERIPLLVGNKEKAMDLWFSEMADRGLIFHPEDSADTIVSIANGAPFFSKMEAATAQEIINGFFARFGDEAVVDAAYPHFMRAAGMPAGEG